MSGDSVTSFERTLANNSSYYGSTVCQSDQLNYNLQTTGYILTQLQLPLSVVPPPAFAMMFHLMYFLPSDSEYSDIPAIEATFEDKIQQAGGGGGLRYALVGSILCHQSKIIKTARGSRCTSYAEECHAENCTSFLEKACREMDVTPNLDSSPRLIITLISPPILKRQVGAYRCGRLPDVRHCCPRKAAE